MVIKGLTKTGYRSGRALSHYLNTMSCPYCYGKIANKATVCPHCHKEMIALDDWHNFAYKDRLDSNDVDYKIVCSDLGDTVSLYENDIYSEDEFIRKKTEWIENLRTLDFESVETKFLNEMLPFIKNKMLDESEVKKIRYIISGDYYRDKVSRDREELEKQVGSEKGRSMYSMDSLINDPVNYFNLVFIKVKEKMRM